MNHAFMIYPAIDLRRGQVVRLMQGDPQRQTTYAKNPVKVALRWVESGAQWLHIVNLDGAFGETGAKNLNALHNILERLSILEQDIQIQFGGGVRTLEDIERLINAGVRRVMLGSMAAENPGWIDQAIRRFGAESIALAVDVRDGHLHTRGWTQMASIDPLQLGQRLFQAGLRVCAYTDICRDGGQAGLNLQATQNFAERTGLSVIASGGVASLEDVQAARHAGLSGVIIGRALYEGQIDLMEALIC